MFPERNPKNQEPKTYPNRAKLREMYDRRINRKLTYQQFKGAVIRDIDRHNKKISTETTMNEQLPTAGGEIQ